MWPIFPFIAGIVVGASALGAARKAKVSPRVSEAVDKAGQKIRRVAVSGLDTLQQSSGRWRNRLAGTPAENAADETDESASPAKPEKTSPARKAAPRKSGAPKKEAP